MPEGDDPQRRVSRDDWLNLARDLLVSEGVAEVKVLGLSQRLGVSRSSFYWMFKSRADLLDALLDDWNRTNTGAIVAHCGRPARTINEAVSNVFICFIDKRAFDPRLDFAVREWARRSGPVRRVLDAADDLRLTAIRTLFERFDYPAAEADARARVLYYMQLGYYALELNEDRQTRMSRVDDYLYCYTGRRPQAADTESLRRAAEASAENPAARLVVVSGTG